MQTTIVQAGRRRHTSTQVSHLCPACQVLRQREHLYLSGWGNYAVVDPEEVLVVHAANKRVVFELDDGRTFDVCRPSVSAMLRSYPDLFVSLSPKVLVRRGSLQDAQKMGEQWFITVAGRSGQLLVSRRQWAAEVRAFFTKDSE